MSATAIGTSVNNIPSYAVGGALSGLLVAGLVVASAIAIINKLSK